MKKLAKILMVLGASALASACTMNEPVSRVQPLVAPLAITPQRDEPLMIEPDFKVTAINVSVPETLKVSEANTYKPVADIVWRDDPFGDRYAQVAAVVKAGLERGAALSQGTQEVIVEATIHRFHAQTQKVRYTFGGEHEITFTLTLRDAVSGALIDSREVDATFDALGGQAAVRADAAGMTQKVRITDHLAYVLAEELKKPYAL